MLESGLLVATLSSMNESSSFPQPSDLMEMGSSQIDMNPNAPPWSSFAAVAIWIFSVLMILIVPTVFLMPYLYSKLGGVMNGSELAEIAVKDTTAIFIQTIAILPAHLITLAVAWFVITNNRKFPFFETLGWRSGGIRWWHYIAILGAFVGIMLIVGSLVPEQENEMLRMIRSSKAVLYTIAILSVLTAPLIEEVVYRGILYSAFQRSVGQAAAVVLVTLLFALVHVPQYWPSFSTIFLLTLLSLILTLLRVYSGNLLPSVILHAIFNGLQSVLLVAEPHISGQGPTPVQGIALLFK